MFISDLAWRRLKVMSHRLQPNWYHFRVSRFIEPICWITNYQKFNVLKCPPPNYNSISNALYKESFQVNTATVSISAT